MLNIAVKLFRKEPVQIALLLVGLLCVFFRNVLFSDSTLLTATFASGTMPHGPYGYSGYDVLDVPVRDAGATAWQIEPWDKLISRMYQSGQLPLWNPHQAAGKPLAASMVSAPFFPLKAAIYLVPEEYWPYARDLSLLLQLLIAGFFTFLFARSVGVRRIGALGAASAFMLCGYFILYLGMPDLHAEILIPALLYAFERVLSRRNLSSLLFAAAVVCFSILGGMPEAFFFSFLFAGLYYIYRVLEKTIDKGAGLSFVVSSLGRAGGAAALGILLSSFYLLPFTEFLLLSYHAHPSGVGLVQYAPATAISILVPYFLGGAHGGWQPPYHTMYTVPYVGILPVALAMLAFQRHKRGPRLSYFFVGFSLFFLLKAYGAPLIQWVGLLPGFNVSVFPKYCAPEFAFCVAMLAGLGLDRIFGGQVSVRRVLIAVGLLVTVVGSFLLYHRQAMIEYDAVEYVLDEVRIALVFILLFCVPFLLSYLASLLAHSSRFLCWRRRVVTRRRALESPRRVGAEAVRRVVSSLRDRKLYLLLFLSAALLFLSFRAGLLTSLLDSAPLYSIDVGGENDEAYVQGFHQRERNEWDGSFFRWSKAHSSIVIPGARNMPLEIRLVMNGWRPEDQAAPHVQVMAHGQELANFTAEKQPRTYEFQCAPPMLSPAKDLVLEIYTDIFTPPTDKAQRALGVLVDSVEATPIAGPWWYTDWVSIVALSAAVATSYLVLRAMRATASGAFAGVLILLALVSFATVVSFQQVARFSLFLFVLLPALCGLCYAVLPILSPSSTLQVSVALLGLLLVELFVYLPKERAQRYDPFTTPPYVEFLQQDREKHRVIGLDLVLYPDTASAHGVDDIADLDAMYVERYFTFIRRFICPDCSTRVHGQYPLYDSKFVDLLNVKYLLTIYPLQGRWRTVHWMTPALLETCQITAPQGGAVSADEQWTIQGDTRSVLSQYPPSRLDCPLKVPDRPTMLAFSLAMDPALWEGGQTEGDGVLFEVHVRGPDGQYTVFSKYIDPKSRPADRGWHDAYVDLTSFSGQDVTLSFVTSPGPEEDDRWDWAGWGDLAIVKASKEFAQLPGWAWTRWLSRVEGPDSNEEKWELVYADEIKVYRNSQVFPRAFIVHNVEVVGDETAVLDRMDSPGFDPRTTIVLEEELPVEIVQALDVVSGKDGSAARILEYDPGRVSIEATLETPGFLVLTDTYYPGWKASVDGQESKVYAADYLFRAVYLEEGEHNVEFVYDPLSLKLGLSLSGSTLLGIVAYGMTRRTKAG